MYALIESFYRHHHDRWHESRVSRFLELMRPSPGARVLDLGGADGKLMERIRRRANLDITVADISAPDLERASDRGFKVVQLREGEPLPFGDKSFDIVISNSVIEHVTLPKSQVSLPIAERDWVRESSRAQHEFASEIMRIGNGYFVQTPHRAFPVESHTWLPLVGWLSHNATVQMVRMTDRYWVKYCGYADWHLLGSNDMRALFPGGRIHVERVMGLPKSLIAYSPAQR